MTYRGRLNLLRLFAVCKICERLSPSSALFLNGEPRTVLDGRFWQQLKRLELCKQSKYYIRIPCVQTQTFSLIYHFSRYVQGDSSALRPGLG